MLAVRADQDTAARRRARRPASVERQVEQLGVVRAKVPHRSVSRPVRRVGERPAARRRPRGVRPGRRIASTPDARRAAARRSQRARPSPGRSARSRSPRAPHGRAARPAARRAAGNAVPSIGSPRSWARSAHRQRSRGSGAARCGARHAASRRRRARRRPRAAAAAATSSCRCVGQPGQVGRGERAAGQRRLTASPRRAASMRAVEQDDRSVAPSSATSMRSPARSRNAVSGAEAGRRRPAGPAARSARDGSAGAAGRPTAGGHVGARSPDRARRCRASPWPRRAAPARAGSPRSTPIGSERAQLGVVAAQPCSSSRDQVVAGQRVDADGEVDGRLAERLARSGWCRAAGRARRPGSSTVSISGASVGPRATASACVLPRLVWQRVATHRRVDRPALAPGDLQHEHVVHVVVRRETRGSAAG